MKALAFFALAAATILHAAEPLAFKGDALGVDLETFRAKYDRPSEGDPRRAPFVYFGTIFGDQPATGKYDENLQKIGAVRVTKKYPYENRGDSRSDTIANVPAEVQYWFAASNADDWLAASKGPGNPAWQEPARSAAGRIHLGRIAAIFDTPAFDGVVDALKLRYGTPAVNTTEEKQNAMNAKFSSRLVVWEFGDCRVYARERHQDINTSMVEFVSLPIFMRAKIFTEAKTQKAAQDL